MVNARRKNNQIALLKPDPHPIITLTPDVEEPCTIKNVPDLFILMQVLVEEAFDLLLVDVAHLLRRDGDFIPVLVVALLSERVHIVI